MPFSTGNVGKMLIIVPVVTVNGFGRTDAHIFRDFFCFDAIRLCVFPILRGQDARCNYLQLLRLF